MFRPRGGTEGLADRPEGAGEARRLLLPAPSGRERGKRAGARCRSRGILSELKESPLTIPKKFSGRDFDFPPRPPLKRPKERPAGLSFGNLSEVYGGFVTGDVGTGDGSPKRGVLRRFRCFRLVGDEVIEGLVVLAGDWVGEGPAGDGGRGTPYLGHGLRQPNFVPKFGASVRVVVPYGGLREGFINCPGELAHSGALAAAGAREGGKLE